MNPTEIGVDIGGSHIACAAIDLSTHRIIPGTGSAQKIYNKAGAGEILNGWSNAIAGTMAVIDKKSLAGIGFAMPGPFDYTKGIALFERVEKYESLYGINVSEELKKRLNMESEVPFKYINDATAFAIAEAWIGKGKDFENVIALTLGTGFGSAFIKHGLPVISSESVPEMGCLWHLPYKNGIANDYFSTLWFMKRYYNQYGIWTKGVKELSELADSDLFVKELFEEYGTGMGEFLNPWIRKFEAETVIIGGNITGAYHLFGHQLEKSLLDHSPAPGIYISELKEDAAIFGAVRLLDESFWLKIKDLLSLM